MWNTFMYEGETYIIKIIKSLSYKITLSNIVNLWIEELSIDEIIERCKSSNPLLNTDNEIFIKTVLGLVENIFKNEIKLIKEDEVIKLECKTKLGTASFKFNFILKLTNTSDLSKDITVPLIQTIQYLETKQKDLCELLARKDEEIQQHIFENGGIKRESVTTEKFDIEKFNQNISKNLCCNIFSISEDFSKTLIEKYGCSEPTLLTVKKEEKKGTKHKISVPKAIIKHKRRIIETKNIKIKDEV